jgi:hypothetical protein
LSWVVRYAHCNAACPADECTRSPRAVSSEMSARHAWRARKSLISRLYRRGRWTDAAARAGERRSRTNKPTKSDDDGAILAAIMMRLGGGVVGHLSLSRGVDVVAAPLRDQLAGVESESLLVTSVQPSSSVASNERVAHMATSTAPPTVAHGRTTHKSGANETQVLSPGPNRHDAATLVDTHPSLTSAPHNPH